MNKIACVFPGQGSQSVGMGKELFEGCVEARSTFAAIDELAGYSLSSLCFAGPEDALKRTVNTQPTILAVSLAAWQAFKAQMGTAFCPDFVAGHSLGEFTALVASGTLKLEQALPLVLRRAQLMDECPTGAMSAVIGMSSDRLIELCGEISRQNGQPVVVANFNSKEQLVVSGEPKAVNAVADLAKKRGARVIPLPVGGAFHSPLMTQAACEFEQEINQCVFADASIPVVQNYDALGSTKADDIKDKLIKQMPNSVRWCESIEYMLSCGTSTFIEIGPGKALSGMIKKINRSCSVFNIADMTSLRATVEALHQLAPTI